MTEKILKRGVVYPATMKGVDWVDQSLYLGERRYNSRAPKAYLVAFRDSESQAALRGFTRFELKKGVLIMKFMYPLKISSREREYLETKLQGAGI